MAASSNPACAVPSQMQMGQGQPVAEVKLLLAPKPIMYPHLSQLPYLLQEGLAGEVQDCKPDATTLFWVKPEQGCGGQALLAPQLPDVIQPVVPNQQPPPPLPPPPQQSQPQQPMQPQPQQQPLSQQQPQQPDQQQQPQQQVSSVKAKGGSKEQRSSKSGDGTSPWVSVQGCLPYCKRQGIMPFNDYVFLILVTRFQILEFLVKFVVSRQK